MRWLPGSLATQTRQVAGLAIDRSSPLARELLFASAGPVQHGRPSAAIRDGLGWASNTASFQPGISFPTGYNPAGMTALSVGIINGTANSANQQAGIRVSSSPSSNSFALGARLIDFAANGQSSFSVQYSDFSAQTVGPISHGVSTSGGRLAMGLTWRRNTTAGLRAFVNGAVVGSANSSNLSLFPSSMAVDVHVATGGTNCQGYLTAFNALWARALTDEEMRALSDNPWQLFAPTPRPLWAPSVASVTIYRPGSDISVGGWTATGAASLFDAINEVSASDTDYITGPDLSTPTVLGLTASMPAGNYTVRVRSSYTGGSGQVRVRFLNTSNVDVGGTAWQAVTGTLTTYTLSATTTGTADRFRIEVQP